MYDTKKMP
jgi:cinnamoyl-CoA reductase